MKNITQYHQENNFLTTLKNFALFLKMSLQLLLN